MRTGGQQQRQGGGGGMANGAWDRHRGSSGTWMGGSGGKHARLGRRLSGARWHAEIAQ
jgi:hypothetical protein